MEVMTAALAAGRRVLPRGYAHLALQLAIWLGFYAAYQVARGWADRDVGAAFEHGRWIIDFQRGAGGLFEVSLQEFVEQSSLLIQATSYTYWLSQFTVVAIALLWVYVRSHDSFYAFRNTLIVANLIGLVGYVLVPTAPPRMFPEFGFEDTLAAYAAVDHSSGLVAFSSNPYAAMPSRHATDALIVGVAMAFVVRSWWARVLWLAWPAWVWFSVMATGNHFWLDIAAGVAVAGLAAALALRGRVRSLWA